MFVEHLLRLGDPGQVQPLVGGEQQVGVGADRVDGGGLELDADGSQPLGQRAPAPGQLAGSMLAQLGAEVVEVEPASLRDRLTKAARLR